MEEFLIGTISIIIVMMIVITAYWFSIDNQINRLINRIRQKNVFYVETETYILHISKTSQYSSFFINKKTKWKNHLKKANTRTKKTLYYEIKRWFLDSESSNNKND